MAEDQSYHVPDLKFPKEYHAFITHCDDDLIFAKTLMEDLTNLGFKCLFAKRDFTPGTAVVENIANAIIKSRRIVMVISKASLDSGWCNYEMVMALTNDVYLDRVSIIPLLLEDVTGKDLPYPLKYFTWIHAGEEPTGYLKKLIDVLSAPVVSLKYKFPAGNVAHGLAWSYYFGYLKFVLPGIHNCIMQSEFWNGDKNERNMCKKIIFLFPESCRCYSTLTEDDPNIKIEGHLAPVVRNRAGTVGRRYKNTVYSVLDGQKRYYFVGEYITAIHTMYEMEICEMAGLSTSFKNLQAASFYVTVKNILSNDPKCMNKFKIIRYEDSGELPVISSLLLKKIKKEIKKDIDLENLENTHDGSSNVMDQAKSIEADCNTSIQQVSVHDSNNEDIDISYEITNDFYNFILFDSPEEEPVVIRDEAGEAKSIERGDKMINFLTKSSKE